MNLKYHLKNKNTIHIRFYEYPTCSRNPSFGQTESQLCLNDSSASAEMNTYAIVQYITI